MGNTYLDWVIENTATQWWHDSADDGELDRGLERGCIGVTTNPVLAYAAVQRNRERWHEAISPLLAMPPEQKAEALMRIAVTNASRKLMPRFEAGHGRAGFVCAQVNPMLRLAVPARNP